ncbi:MAG: FAD-dependent oxidoreductase, partial [Burkholderiales bacterium]
MTERYDAIVIGAGQAGPALCARLDREGQKTALIERKLIGGTCINTGCIPTKTLVASAHAAHLARRGAEFGFSTGGVTVDMAAVKRRKDGVVQQSVNGVTNWIAGMKNVTLIRGHARFTAPRTIAVDGRVLQAERVFLNVGGRAFVPEIPGVHEVPYFTNTSMMEVESLPEHLVIIGGSYIGLEFAQMYR